MTADNSATRFRFIAHALNGDGPFRPSVSYDGSGNPVSVSACALVRYPRESMAKYARRCEVAFYSSPLQRASSRFVGYLTTKPVAREVPHELYQRMVGDIDGRGSDIDTFWSGFGVNAKARGSMLLLVDMPPSMAETSTLAQQITNRVVPFWLEVLPEDLTAYELGDDGKFTFAEFSGEFVRADETRVPCTWRFDRVGWAAFDREKKPLDAAPHGLGECPLLIFTEGGTYPHFGPFATIADMACRLYNLDSELDEILRSQTFSLLTMQVPDGTANEIKLTAAKTVGETIGTQNLLVHEGSTPSFIAPPDGPATVYLQRIDKMRDQIDEVGLNVASINQQESGIAMRMRFAAINGELAKFSARMEDLETRAWELSARWLAMDARPTAVWPRDFNLADVVAELQVLSDMQAAAMPPPVIAEQQRRIVSAQFGFIDSDRLDELMSAIDEPAMERRPPNNVVPLSADVNAPVRAALVKALESA